MKVLLLLSLLLIMSCSKNDSAPADPADQVYGSWYYQAPGGSSTSAKGIVATLDKNGSVQFAYVSGYASGGTAAFYTRKSIGSFTRSGEAFSIKYTYETCNPVNQETLYIKMRGDNLLVSNSDRSVTFTMARPSATISNQMIAVIEDKNCNILSKADKESTRSVANVKTKSVFDIVK